MAFEQIKNKLGIILGYVQTDNQERLGVHNLLHVQDRKAAGTAGGTFTSGAYRTRDFNTVVVNNIAGASLTNNQVNLPAGTYYIEGWSEGYKVNSHSIRVQKVSAPASTLITGITPYTAASLALSSYALYSGLVELDAESIVEIQHICQTTFATYGLGDGTNVGQAHNIYSDLKIWKVA